MNYLDDDSVFFVDGSSPFLGMPSDARYIVDDYSKIKETVMEAIDEVPGGIAVINNLSVIIDYLGNGDTLEIVEEWNRRAADRNVNMVYLFTEWDYERELVDKLRAAWTVLLTSRP